MDKKLAKSSLLFSLMTLFSRVFGFVRDIVLATVFGAGPALDAFVLAFRIPNLLRRLFAEGAFSQAFVPTLAEVESSLESTEKFTGKVMGNLALVVAIISLVGMFFATFLVKIFAPGFAADDPRLAIASSMLVVTFPYIFFISLTALSSAILHVNNRFIVAAITPVILSLSLIIGAIFFRNYFVVPEMALAYAVFIAGLLQMIFQLYVLAKLGKLPHLRIDWRDTRVIKVITLMIPATYGAAIGQINLLVDSFFASFLPSGSMSWLYFADRLMEFPLGVVGVALTTVLLPNLAKSYTQNNTIEFDNRLIWGLQTAFILALPAAVGLYLIALPLVKVLLGSNNFMPQDILMTAKALQAYAGAIAGLMLAKIFSNAFYAQQDIRTPVKISTIVLLVNISLNYLLIGKFQHVGLAYATSIASLVDMVLLGSIWGFKYNFKFTILFKTCVPKVMLAMIAMVLFINYFTPSAAQWIIYTRFQGCIHLAWIISGAIFCYFSALRLSGYTLSQLLSS